MSSSKLSLVRIGPESDVPLRNLFEHYLHDMAEWFQFDAEPDGRYAYDISEVWTGGYDAYLAKVGETLAGFALIGSAQEWLGRDGAHDVHEFFVMRKFRRHGIGLEMAKRLWDERPGEWLVRVLEANLPAVPFWRAATSGYSPGSFSEEPRIVNGRPWLFFRLSSDPARRPIGLAPRVGLEPTT